jgi:hypothetical protein
MRVCAVLAVAATLALSPLARAHDVRPGVSEQDIAQALSAKELPFRLGADNFHEPLIESHAGKIKFYVYFYDCDQARRCSNIQFRAGFSTHGGLTLARINDWSTRWRFGRLYLDPEGDAILDMDVDVARGVTAEQLGVQLDRWLATMQDAVGFLGWRG